jgi:hypothetical protein
MLGGRWQKAERPSCRSQTTGFGDISHDNIARTLKQKIIGRLLGSSCRYCEQLEADVWEDGIQMVENCEYGLQ